MARIMIDEKILEEFSQILADIQFDIKIAVNRKNINREVVYDLIDGLIGAWNEIYNPAERTISKSIRLIYSQYIQAKKNGDKEKAVEYLRDYLYLKNQLKNSN